MIASRIVAYSPVFGPHQKARYSSATALLEGDFIGIEAVGGRGMTAMSDWRKVSYPEIDRRIETLFPEVNYTDVSPGRLRNVILERLDRHRPQVVVVPGWSCCGSLTCHEWALWRGARVVLMSETNGHDAVRAWWKDEPKRRLVGQCGAALVGGRWHREYLVELGMGAERIFDGYDVVDNKRIRQGARAARQEVEEVAPHFFACARFEPKKNFERLIAAYACYARGSGAEAWRLVIAGGGPSRGALENLASQLGVAEGVVFAGLLGYEEVPLLYGRAGAFVHASTTEQWGLVVNEAMAAGLPVIVSERCGCVAELVKDGENGFTFDPWKPEELAEKMALIAGDAEMRERMGRRSEEIIADWGPERFAKGLKAAVECALERGPVRGTMLSRAVVRMMAMR